MAGRQADPIVAAMEPPLDALIAYKGAAVAAWLGLLFVGERLLPAAAPPSPAALGGPEAPAGGRARLGRNGGMWLINTVLSPLVVVPLSAWATGHGLGLRPAWWSGWGGLLADLILLDFLIYWWHRLNHEAPLLWRFHEIHHLDRFLDTTTALRFHFGEVLLSALVRAGAIAVLGLPVLSVLAFETLLLAATIFHHSNLRLPAGLERRLARVVITPSIHWVHHHRVRRDTDSNYGTVFSLWDGLFGSRSPTRRTPAMTIGVEGQPERPFLSLLARPFARR